MGSACSTHVKLNAYRILVGKSKTKRPVGRPRCRWEDNNKLDLREIGWGCKDRISLVQQRDQWKALVNMTMTLLVP
jgi:hypothetical protein